MQPQVNRDWGPSLPALIRNRLGHAPANRDASILVIDSNLARRSSSAGALAPLGCRVVQAGTTEQALPLLENGNLDLIIADMFVPDLGGIGLCQAVREPGPSAQLPVLIMTSAEGSEDEILALEAGADVVLRHSADPRALRASVQSCLRRSSKPAQPDETESILFALAQSVEERDPSLGQHCERLALMAAGMGTALGLGHDDILALQRGGYLHDIGKVAIPDGVLFKPGPLSPEEWALMKSHTERGERICSNVRSLAPVLPIIRHHHERWDGGGYPDGLKGENIPLLARIVQITDIYDALTTARPYKRAYRPIEALTVLREETERGWRDPKIVEVFCDLLPVFSPAANANWTHLSLQSLASSLDRFRKDPSRAQSPWELTPVKMASGL